MTAAAVTENHSAPADFQESSLLPRLLLSHCMVLVVNDKNLPNLAETSYTIRKLLDANDRKIHSTSVQNEVVFDHDKSTGWLEEQS